MSSSSLQSLQLQLQPNTVSGGHGHGPTQALHSQQQSYIDKEHRYGAHNYHPLPVVLSKGERCFLYDTEGRKYFDFLSAYSAVNQGHCHPRIIKVLKSQAEKLTLTSRAFHNNVFGDYLEYITKFFKYDKFLPMNSGVEGTETACKLMRRWAYLDPLKKVPEDKAVIIFAANNFWGRSIAAVSSSTDPDCYSHFGPFAPGFLIVEYNNLDSMRKTIEETEAGKNGWIAGVCLEPIQGEAGIIIPTTEYFQGVQSLCKKHNILLCCDEIQTGLGRTGKMLCSEHYGIRPDLVVLGKALSGGCYPVSGVLADDRVMNHITPGSHGSTYGGNPLGCAIAKEALQVLKDENLVQNAEKLGNLFRNELKEAFKGLKFVKDIRGKGLLNAIECDPKFSDSVVSAWQLCVDMAKNGQLLAKPTHNNIIRFAPPLCITESEMKEAINIIKREFLKYGGNKAKL